MLFLKVIIIAFAQKKKYRKMRRLLTKPTQSAKLFVSTFFLTNNFFPNVGRSERSYLSKKTDTKSCYKVKYFMLHFFIKTPLNINRSQIFHFTF